MARRKRAMTEDEVASAVTGQIDDARAFAGTDVDTIREKALKFFEGEVDMPPMSPTGSKVVNAATIRPYSPLMRPPLET